ncbi:cell envelope integrity protein CreD [Sediminibacterium soli]|uniref:cell envelope integrity protein CreD n=1 Tax=Sediminibacterium soli TaxID=2698829 RepID=UPI00137B091F|nr:cell envelope integrity protein CreD [Sediminibacterium soli]NCI47528.1 cell envelope integrity protein CreD [Sediminibacterium soli]
MEFSKTPFLPRAIENAAANRPFTKGLITAALTLLLLIPTLFIANLVEERQNRQAQVVADVSSKWASAQRVTGPYLYIPFVQQEKMPDGTSRASKRYLYLLPDNLSVTADIVPEQRPRSIYKVLLYRSSVTAKGNLSLSFPAEFNSQSLLLSEARVCIGITDFKGIEKKIAIGINGKTYDLLPGLPAADMDSVGLSAAIDLSGLSANQSLEFSLPMQLRGSRQLHFAPMAGSSRFTIRSAWPDPSFDGSTLPSEREIKKDGFTAVWEFSRANLPFNTVLSAGQVPRSSFDFGVSMLQPTDQYAKTARSIKYAILVIGLSFALFFIIEIMQQRPMHPVQYVLIGMALSIFYILLLSLSEFILFNQAYLVAAAATLLLVTLYVKSHFRQWKTALVFGSVLAGLYTFIFILIQLEDTALLLGSIGLFLILGGIMFLSRKVNWYPVQNR